MQSETEFDHSIDEAKINEIVSLTWTLIRLLRNDHEDDPNWRINIDLLDTIAFEQSGRYKEFTKWPVLFLYCNPYLPAKKIKIN